MNVDNETLKQLLEETLAAHFRVNAEIHNAHHDWLKEKIDAEKDKKLMYRQIAIAVAQWSVIGLIGGFIYWLRNGHLPS